MPRGESEVTNDCYFSDPRQNKNITSVVQMGSLYYQNDKPIYAINSRVVMADSSSMTLFFSSSFNDFSTFCAQGTSITFHQMLLLLSFRSVGSTLAGFRWGGVVLHYYPHAHVFISDVWMATHFRGVCLSNYLNLHRPWHGLLLTDECTTCLEQAPYKQNLWLTLS